MTTEQGFAQSDAVPRRRLELIERVSKGTVTTPKGFKAGGVYVGLKSKAEGVLDLGMLYSALPCTSAGVFTTNKVKAAPVLVSLEHLDLGSPQSIVANSGCANACTGDQGISDARDMASLAASICGISEKDVLVASTGVIGVNLDMVKVRSGFKEMSLSEGGGHQLARAIMTTDTAPKEVAVAVNTGEITGYMGGIAKGAAMIHPNMATMLSFLSTDFAVEKEFLQRCLRTAVDNSFNMITIDGDTSTNDTVVVLANGACGAPLIDDRSPLAGPFAEGLEAVCMELSKAIVRDAEGATKLIEVRVEGALNSNDARIAARTVAGSMLVKSAIYGEDPNWGRILMAVGRSGAEVVESKLELFIGEHKVLNMGQPLVFDVDKVRDILKQSEVSLTVRLHLGHTSATAWGCDLTESYVTLNSAYTT